jgi:hypothetical protein
MKLSSMSFISLRPTSFGTSHTWAAAVARKVYHEIEELGCDQDLGQIGLRVAERFFDVFHVGSLAARRNVHACRLSDLCFAANFLRAAATPIRLTL